MNIRFKNSITNPKECEIYFICGFISSCKVKVKLSLYRLEQAWTNPQSSSRFKLPEFLQSAYEEARFSTLSIGHL
jgi:hypothetical protein